MKYYELTYLITPDLLEEELKAFSEKINSLIQTQGGVLDKSSKAIKRKLGFPIKKKTSAFLKTITFHLNPEKLAGLEKTLKGDKKILRFLILNKKVKRIALEVPEKAKILKSKPKEKVELKDIEEKLKEILEE